MLIKDVLSQLKQLRQDRSVYIVQIIIAVAIIIDYAVYDTLNDVIGDWFYLLPLMLIIPSLVLPIGEYTTPRAKKLLLILYHAIVASILILLTDVFGPYFQLLNLLLFTSAIWYGAKGVVLSILVNYLIIWTAFTRQFPDPTHGDLSQLALYLTGLTVLAILFERVTYYHKAEIKEQKEASQNFHFERTRLLSLINSMADAVVATDRRGKILLYNGAALELLNTNETLHDKTLEHFIQLHEKESGDEFKPVNEAAKAYGPIVRDDVYYQAADGSEVDLNISISPVTSPGISRKQAGFVMVMRDITKQKTLDEQRDEFISIASHELRTPIAIAEANISTALLPKFSQSLSKEGRDLLDQAHENVVFLSNLVNDLHVLAQAEQGRLELDIIKVSPKQLLDKLYHDYHEQAEEKGLELKLDVDDGLEQFATSLDAVKEIMQNFITNAIKYTEKGSITLFAKPGEEGQGVTLGVSDTGIGISVADQKHVFEKFYRSEDYRTRKSGGTGLGLYITKRLLERMGGKVWFESKLNKGSTFYCWLPHVPKEQNTADDKSKDSRDEKAS